MTPPQRSACSSRSPCRASASARETLIPLRQLEADYIAWVVSQCGRNKTRAAEILGIDVSTIHRRERAGLQ